MKRPLVSVIVTTYNNHATLDACLTSIVGQDYPSFELIVVDNSSKDDTQAIAKRYTPHVYNRGPERSAQRNYAVQKAEGEYVVIIDSDMELTPHVVSACVDVMQLNKELGGVVIPEESFGVGFWAQCKHLERSFYVGVSWVEAARFFKRDLFVKVGGYDSDLVSGEDWDLSRRIADQAPLGRINEFILHNEGRLALGRTLQKKFYYAGKAEAFLAKHAIGGKLSSKEGPLQRYKLFFAQPKKLFKQPVLGIGMLFMKTCEYGAGALGYYQAKRRRRKVKVASAI